MRDAVPATSVRQLRIAAIVLVAVVGLLGAAYYWFLTGDYAVLATAEKTLHRPTYVVAFAVIVIGIAAFVSIFLRF